MHYWSLACSTADFLYMTANLLTLNSSQTEFLLIALEQQPAKTNLLTCQQPLSLLTLLVLSFLIYFAGVLQIKLLLSYDSKSTSSSSRLQLSSSVTPSLFQSRLNLICSINPYLQWPFIPLQLDWFHRLWLLFGFLMLIVQLLVETVNKVRELTGLLSCPVVGIAFACVCILIIWCQWCCRGFMLLARITRRQNSAF